MDFSRSFFLYFSICFLFISVWISLVFFVGSIQFLACWLGQLARHPAGPPAGRLAGWLADWPAGCVALAAGWLAFIRVCSSSSNSSAYAVIVACDMNMYIYTSG